MRPWLLIALVVLCVLAVAGECAAQTRGKSQPDTAVPETLTDDQLLWRARQFHGHAGPWLTLGIVMGQYAVERLGGQKYGKLNVSVAMDAVAPQISIMDGLQLSTGCTLGKRNITLTQPARRGARVRVTFVGSRGEGDTLTLEVLPQVHTQFVKWLRSGEDEKVVFKRVYHMQIDQFFREVR